MAGTTPKITATSAGFLELVREITCTKGFPDFEQLSRSSLLSPLKFKAALALKFIVNLVFVKSKALSNPTLRYIFFFKK